MEKIKDLLIIGGDSRQLYMADHLEERGFNIAVYGLPERARKCVKELKSAVEAADAVILPLPVTRDGRYVFSIVPVKETFDEMAAMFHKDQPIFAGMLSHSMRARLEKRCDEVYDYFEREDVTVMNSVPTAQGILKTMLENIEYTVHSSKCAVFGYGRIGKVTADVLSAVGADVTVCVRRPSAIALAAVNGLGGCLISDFYKSADRYDIIINTVPAQVIDRKILKNVRPDCLIIDVASAPYGTDFAAAHELGINALQCSSLPGKTAPKTAGRIIADGVINILKEREYE